LRLQGKIQATIPSASDLIIRWRLLFDNVLAHSGVMFRRKLIDIIGPYDESVRFAQDYELWSRMIQVTKVANLQEPLLVCRRGYADRISEKHLREQQDHSFLTSASNIRQLIGDHAFTDERVRKLRALVFLDRTRAGWDLQTAYDLEFVLERFLARYAEPDLERYDIDRSDLKAIARHIGKLAWHHLLDSTSSESWTISRQLLLTMVRQRLPVLQVPHSRRMIASHMVGQRIAHHLLLGKFLRH